MKEEKKKKLTMQGSLGSVGTGCAHGPPKISEAFRATDFIHQMYMSITVDLNTNRSSTSRGQDGTYPYEFRLSGFACQAQ